MQKTPTSRLLGVDFANLPFGRVFSDHMMVMDYVDGQWQKPTIKPFATFQMNPAASVIHYGQSIFEGMKAFKSPENEVLLFRPEQNIKRFNISAKRMCMPDVPEDIFREGLLRMLDLDRGWVQGDDESSLYIRPFMFATDEYIGVKPSETYRFMIFTCPVKKYYKGSVKVKIEEEYSRSMDGGTGFAKAAGNYAASLYPAKLAQEQGYDQLLWTDAKEHKFIEESGTMNVVFRSGNTVFSPPVSETILRGITRDSVLELAKDYGYTVENRPIEVAEIISMLKKGQLHEAFGAGTAATIAPISTINFRGEDFELPPMLQWDFANKVGKHLTEIKRGREEDTHNWNTVVPKF
ncbi:MAG: branched-chain amino acid aminotransferase [Flavobacteriales bacterium]|nr:branched-chain amino acid aminotransferase [Flavobacteriales bacterium]